MSSESFNSIPAESASNQEQEPTDYFEKQIFRLNQDIEGAEAEKSLLFEMAGYFTDGQTATPEIVADLTAEFAKLKRFQKAGSMDAATYVGRLAEDAKAGNPQFAAQIDVLNSYQIEWYSTIDELKNQQAAENSAN
jgi:hypothetical protein